MRSRVLKWVTGAAVVAVVFTACFLYAAHPAFALPEYAQRTNESCSTCHVNPGGGGPRTMRGLIWAAKGKPDAVPALQGVLLAPGVSDGAELYQIACSSCHGVNGEGMLGTRLLEGGVNEAKVRSNIQRGRLSSGMPAFTDSLTTDQIEALTVYVFALESGKADPVLNSYPLELPQLQGTPESTPMAPRGN